MAPNRATSPTGMLWAHQLKREHGFLLDRMKRLESEITKVESTAKSAKNAYASHDVAAIANQVKALTEDGGSKATEKMRKEVMERLENVDAEMAAITSKVAELDRNSARDEQERKRVFNNEKDLLKRIKEVERHLTEYEQNLNRIGDKVNEQQMDVIREQLANLLDQVKEDGGDRESFRESLQVLEEVTRELKQDNDRLTREIKVLGKRPAVPTMPPPPPMPAPAPSSASTPKALPMPKTKQSVITRDAPPPAATQTQKNGKRWSGTACSKCRKTHQRCTHVNAGIDSDDEDGDEENATQGNGKRWSGTACPACRKAHIRCTHGSGGTDSDEEDEEESTSGVTAPRARAPASKPGAVPKPAPDTVAKTKPQQAQNKTARTSRAIKQEVLDTQASRVKTKAPAARGLQREIQELKAASQSIKQEPLSRLAAQKPAVAVGRGWVNVERTPSANKNVMDEQSPQDDDMLLTAAERVKQGRGRPKKNLQDPPPPVAASTRGRGHPTKNASQLSTQIEAPKRGPGRPRKDGTQPVKKLVETPKRARGRPRKTVAVEKNVADTPKRPRGRPRKDGLQTPAARPAAPALQIKQEHVESRLQPLRETKAAQTTEASSPVAAAPVKKEPGREKKQSALEALKKKTAAAVKRSEFSASPLSSGMPTPPKRKAAEQLKQQRQLKRRNIVDDGDSDY